ncbi:MAG: glutamate--cysteine ligase [Candidatus Nanopelagicales bacterium]|jgi:carboxylate-amine ligase|nr:glutamate--cysteine ligase [Candidatus Nanopelagicales bacterium]
MTTAFHGSPTHTLGVEIEMGIVHDATDALECAAPEVLAEASAGYPDGQHPHIHRELFQSTLELVTGICGTPAQARADLGATVAELTPILRRRHLALIGTGVHPFSSWSSLRLTDDPRYARLVERIAWPARRMMIHGVHFHVGVPSGDHAIAVTNGLTALLPHLVALSASSPYWFGDDTGLASMRTKVFESMPQASLPPALADWAEFEHLAGILVRAGTIESVKELWWDIRPSPSWGTVELRMCDGMATLTELAALAALAQAAVADLCARFDAGEQLAREPDWVLRENKWRAARYGIEAQLVHGDGSVSSLAEEVAAWVERVRPQAAALGSTEELEGVLAILEHQPSYARQRAVVAAGGTLRDVVELLRREFANDRVGG